MALSIAKIRSFMAVAEVGSFRLAAEIVGRSQSAVSAQIQSLEEQLGVALLSRNTRRVLLTDQGQRFLNRARRVVSELDLIVAELREESTLQRGSISVGIIPTIAAHVFPHVVREFASRFPGVNLFLIDQTAEALQRRVETAEIELSIGPMPPASSGLKFEPVLEDQFVVVAPSDHSFSEAQTIDVEVFLSEPIVSMVKGTSVRSQIEQSMNASGFTFTPRYEAAHHYTLGGMVQAGLGITLLPKMALPLIGYPETCSIVLKNMQICRTIGIVTRSDYVRSPAAEAFLKMFRAFVSSYTEQHLQHTGTAENSPMMGDEPNF